MVCKRFDSPSSLHSFVVPDPPPAAGESEGAFWPLHPWHRGAVKDRTLSGVASAAASDYRAPPLHFRYVRVQLERTAAPLRWVRCGGGDGGGEGREGPEGRRPAAGRRRQRWELKRCPGIC